MAPWLTKAEVNAHYYNTVTGEISFVTEAQAGPHVKAVARLISLHARALGRRRIRILELAANDCAFARSLNQELRVLIAEGVAELDRIDYVAVEYARGALEAAAAWEEENGTHDRVLRGRVEASPGGPTVPGRPTLVALLVIDGPPSFNVGLVHAEANQFVHSTTERFDFVIVNELLDDLPYRAFYAGADGVPHEAVAHSSGDQDGWTVRVAGREVEAAGPAAGLAPRTFTAHSAEALELVTGVSSLLATGGMLLMHDYGFPEAIVALEGYEYLPPSLPSFVTMDYPEGSESGFPRSFFRVFGNEALRVVQVTNDVNFAELTAVLEPTGTVLVLPHGNALFNRPDGRPPERGDGVFLTEFAFLEPGDDLPGLLADLGARQQELRESYVREAMGGHANVFLDLVYVKA